MIDKSQSTSRRIRLRIGDRLEVNVVDIDVPDSAGRRRVLAAPTVDEIEERVADALDCRNVELHRPRLRVKTPGAKFKCAAVRLRGIAYSKSNCANRRSVKSRKALRKGIGLGVDDEVHASLTVKRDVLVAMSGYGQETHRFKKLAKRHRIGCGVFNELEAIRAHWVVPAGELHRNLLNELPATRCSKDSAAIHQ